MLKIIVPGVELWNERTQEFESSEDQTLQLEHSLVSLSKWEAKWKKPFISKDEKTTEEVIDYVKCMTITQNVKDEVYYRLSDENMNDINNYIQDKMTATWFNQREPNRPSREQITSELIYYWMIQFNIPFECQKWHLNRLLTLINICGVKNQPAKKQSQKDMINRYSSLNAARRKQFNTRG